MYTKKINTKQHKIKFQKYLRSKNSTVLRLKYFSDGQSGCDGENTWESVLTTSGSGLLMFVHVDGPLGESDFLLYRIQDARACCPQSRTAAACQVTD